jgi:hypothetical protein
MPLEDAIGVCAMLVKLGRAVDPREWVEWMVDDVQAAAMEALF